MTEEITLVESALSIESLMKQRTLVVQAMKDLMKEGLHYGLIPGTGDKPSLYQPGAQLLGFMFRLRPEYVIEKFELPKGHREYQVSCRLLHSSGGEVSQGVGLCSSMESKYRLRRAQTRIEWTPDTVPGIYWGLKNKPAEQREWVKRFYEGEEGYTAKRHADGNYYFAKVITPTEDKVENPNIADTFNTVLKIGKKRAFVDAIITATASNDLFTQDLEDTRDELDELDPTPKPTKDSKPADKPKTVEQPKAGSRTKTPADNAPDNQNASEGKPEATTRESGGGVKTWRDTVVHVGEKKGSVYGKRLGDLPEMTITTLRKKMDGMPEAKRTKEDNMLIAAIAAHDAERQTGTPPDDGKQTPMQMFIARAEASAISGATLLKVCQNMGSKATALADVDEETVVHLLKDWDATLGLVKDEEDALP